MDVMATGFVPLGSITKWLSGGTPSRAIESFWNGSIPWISASTLRVTEVFRSDQNVTMEAVASGSKMAPVGSTLLLVRGSALHNEILAGLVTVPVCFNQDVKALIPDKSVLPKFLTHSLLGRQAELLRLVSSAGNTAGVLDTKLIQAFPVWVPYLEEQATIVAALDDLDALLDCLDRLIAKKHAIKQATMQQLMTGKTRLPGFYSEWQITCLEKLADIRSGGTPSTADEKSWGGKIPWCTPTDITALEGRKYLEKTSRTITEHGLHGSSAELIPSWSVVMTSRATIGQCAINTEVVTTNQGFKNFVPHDGVDVEFLYYLLCMQTRRLIDLAVGSTFLEIGKAQLQQYEVKVPVTKAEQTAIATILTDMDAEITALETRRDKTRALKQAMMQELLTGKTRLVPPS